MRFLELYEKYTSLINLKKTRYKFEKTRYKF